VTAVLEASGLGKRYGRRWALAGCTLAVPAGRVTGLVGPNGAGKTTLLQLAAGLLTPNSGTIEVLGERPAGTPAQLARVGFVAQDTPVYPGLSVAGHLRRARGSTPAGTASSPGAASAGSALTSGSGPGRCPVASGPSSP
jgi:ABC-2 type transport system ATP-binding protein